MKPALTAGGTIGIRVEALGGVRVLQDGREVADFPDKRIRCALLVYLAVVRKATRDRLVGLFWPDQPPADARHRLSQTLYQLRKDLGGEWLETHLVQVQATGQLTSDVHDLGRALGRDPPDHETVLDLYSGAFLEAVDFDPGRGRYRANRRTGDWRPFEEWTERERQRLGEAFRAALRMRLDRALDKGDTDAALATAERWAIEDPYSEDADYRLIQLRGEVGLRSQALEQYEKHLTRLEGAPPARRIQELAARIRAGDLPLRRARSFGRRMRRTLGSQQGVLVLPFEDQLGSDQSRLLCESLMEEIIGAIGQIDDLRVTPRTSSLYMKRQIDDGRMSLSLAAEEVGATHAMEGYVAARNGGFKVWVGLAAAEPGKEELIHGWEWYGTPGSGDLQRLIQDIPTRLYQELPQKMALRVRADAPSRPRGMSPRGTDPGAHDAYLRGRQALHLRTHEGFDQAVRLFNEAIELDADYAPAFAGIATAHIVKGAFDYAAIAPTEAYEIAKENAQRATELDPQNAEAHAALANAAMSYDWDWKRAEEKFEAAIESEHRHTPARQWYSHFLVVRGEEEEALVQASIALELDGKSHFMYASRGRTRQFLRTPLKAAEDFKRAYELAEEYVLARLGHVLCVAQSGDPQGALTLLARLVPSGGTGARVGHQESLGLAVQGYLLGLVGNKGDAEAVFKELRNRWFEARGKYFFPPEYAAFVCVGMDEPGEAVKWLGRALQAKSTIISLLPVEPAFDPIRHTSGFRDILSAGGHDL